MSSSRRTALSDAELDVSYLALREAIGWIGIFMPWVARLAAKISSGTPLLMSISGYYYTSGRDIFVGSLFGAGLFLSFYRGSAKCMQDRILAVIWGTAAVFIGLIPMNPCGDPHLTCADPNRPSYHFIPVAIFFGINIYMALCRFTKPSRLQVTAQKERRNKAYVACGIGMIVCVLFIAYFDYVKRSVFVPEALAIGLFGIAWLVKGQRILGDKEVPQAASASAGSGV